LPHPARSGPAVGQIKRFGRQDERQATSPGCCRGDSSPGHDGRCGRSARVGLGSASVGLSTARVGFSGSHNGGICSEDAVGNCLKSPSAPNVVYVGSIANYYVTDCGAGMTYNGEEYCEVKESGTNTCLQFNASDIVAHGRRSASGAVSQKV
jgi:hypothetical protein